MAYEEYRDRLQILEEDYPDIWEMWVDAVNADFESEWLHHQGKIKESEAMGKFHEEKWDEYCFASKLVLSGHPELVNEFKKR